MWPRPGTKSDFGNRSLPITTPPNGPQYNTSRVCSAKLVRWQNSWSIHLLQADSWQRERSLELTALSSQTHNTNNSWWILPLCSSQPSRQSSVILRSGTHPLGYQGWSLWAIGTAEMMVCDFQGAVMKVMTAFALLAFGSFGKRKSASML